MVEVWGINFLRYEQQLMRFSGILSLHVVLGNDGSTSTRLPVIVDLRSYSTYQKKDAGYPSEEVSAFPAVCHWFTSR